MSSSNLVRIGYKKEVTRGITPAAVAATASLNLTDDISLTSKLKGSGRNTNTLTLVVSPAAANPAATVLVSFTGSKSAITCTVTPNDGTNNTATPVGLTTAELRELINTGAVVGKTVTITDVSSLRGLQTATGGGAADLADGGEGDGVVATFAGGTGSFKTVRYTSEQYSGTPETTESAQIRTDRQSSGQIVTGLNVEGGHNFELAKEEAIEDFMESAMSNNWQSFAAVPASLTITPGTHTLARATGSFVDDGVVRGDFLKISNMGNAGNNVVVMAMEVTALSIKYAGPEGMVTEGPVAANFQICDKLSIGIIKKPITVEKSFLDLTTKALVYTGCLVSQMDINVEYGSLASGVFQTMATGYESADAASEFASFETDFQDAATSNSMNGSIDMPFLATDVTGAWEQDSFCLQSLNLSLDNNLTVQNCIGKAAPEDHSLGTAQVTVDLSSYLKDGNWGMLERKLTQEPFALGYMIKNLDGWYGFYLPAIQVSFDDPQSGGANQEVSMEMSGVAKVGEGGVSALTIYRAPTA